MKPDHAFVCLMVLIVGTIAALLAYIVSNWPRK